MNNLLCFSKLLTQCLLGSGVFTLKCRDEPVKQSREDYKKAKELEEARKAGSEPAMKDEMGKDINPHIPQYIMQAPWYIGAEQATLRHQRSSTSEHKKASEYAKMGEWFKKGIKEGPVATKFRKGACENCGAMTHKKKDCLERPRKVGAKFTGSGIAPDEHIQADLKFDYDGKRDHWNGMDMDIHQRGVQEEFKQLEQAKRALKEQTLEDALQSGKVDKLKDNEDGPDDEHKYIDDLDMPGSKFETKERITVRNLRIREDTAKYLYNLDPNSAYYDPKTRSMRENPFAGKQADEVPYAGDNFIRVSGDAHNLAKRQVFAWEAYEKGADVHVQADPTRLEMLNKEFKTKKEDFKESQKESILDKYGGREHLDAPPKQLLLAQTEDYVEYSRTGALVKGHEKAIMRSRYEEDILLNNHTAVWGSFWRDGRWGYKCCYSCIKESYCTGEKGRQIEMESVENTAMVAVADAEPDKTLLEKHQDKQDDKRRKRKKKEKKRRRKKQKKEESSSSSSSSSSESESDNEDEINEEKLKQAIEDEKKRQRKVAEYLAMDERKRPYNSGTYNFKEPTKEEMEAYRLTQKNPDDPMAKFL
ncbi:unnamed protein product [Owenia fusiformis]|uniref:Pre-mRNA-splicing factor SLU7 n=1 Tax=Owenia fusiformis TaxID=6347 RepID=A0A8S4NVJ0_OWEFU|nr:unnamed protein product [Owenia fusiformis]